MYQNYHPIFYFKRVRYSKPILTEIHNEKIRFK